MTKKIISLVLIAAMMLTMIPASVFAVDAIDSYLEFNGFPTTWVNEHTDFTITAKDGVTAMSVNGNAVESVGGTIGGGVVTTGGKPYVKYKVLNYDEDTGVLDIGAFIGNIKSGKGHGASFFTFDYDEANWAPFDLSCEEELVEIDDENHYLGGCFIMAYATTDKAAYKMTTAQAKKAKNITLETSEAGAELNFANGIGCVTWFTNLAELDATEYEVPVFRFALVNKGDGTFTSNTITQPKISEINSNLSVFDKTVSSSTQMQDIATNIIYTTDNNNIDYVVEIDGTMYGCSPSVPGTFKYEGNTATAESFKVDITANGTSYSKTYDVLVDTVKPTLTVEPEEITEPVKKVTFTIDAQDDKSGIKEILVNGTAVDKTEYEVTESGTYTFKAIDNAGNESDEITRKVTVDNEGPVLQITGNATEWTNEDVVLTIVTEDGATVTVDGKAVAGNSYTVTENGTYKFVATDKLGNSTEETVVVDKIDKVKPELSAVPDVTDPTNGDVIITVTAEEGATVVVSKDTSDSVVVNGTTYTVTENGTYKFIATDRASNRTEVVVEVANIDKIAPSLSVSDAPIAAVKSHIFTIDPSDNESRIEKVTVSVNGGAERIIGSEYEATVDGTYVFAVYDKAGNKTEVTRIIGEGIIDNTKPMVTVSGAPEGWVNTDVTLTVTTNETATVVAYKDGEEIGTVSGTSYVATETGTYKFAATDVAGNVGESEEYEISIDKIAPTLVRTSSDPAGWNSSYYITFSISDEGGSGMELFTVNGEELNDSSYEVTENRIYTFVLTDKAGNSTVLEIPVTNIDEFYPTISDISELPNTWVKDYNLTFTVSDNETGVSTVTVNGETVRVVNGVVTYPVTANGDVEIIVTDGANNSITNTISIVDVIDDEAPVVEEPELPSELCQEFTLKITATDSQSGVDKVTVDGNDATFNEAEGVWEFLIDANGTYVIKAYDKVGIASEEVEVVVDKIDRIEPGITFPGFEDVWTNEDVVITIAVDKAYETLTVSKDGGDAEVVDGTTYIVTENGSYTFTAIDAAGNEGIKDVTVSKIDKVNPEISVAGKPEGFVKNFNAEITASDDMTDVTITVSVDGGDATVVSGTTYPITANGEYVFTATDLAGNTKDYTLNVDNIDNEAPEINVSFNDEVAKEVIVNVSISDNKSSDITVTLDGEPFTADSFVVTENGDYVLVAVDEAGNEASKIVSIRNIDNEGPTVSLNTAPTEWTNSFILSITANDTQSGVAQIKVNGEAIDGTTYEVPANDTYTVVAVDSLGNESEPVEITVDKLDKDAPSIEVTEAPAEWTKEHTFTVTTSDALSEVKEVTVNGVKLEGATYTVTANGDYKFVVTDNAGNVAEKTVTVDKIDVSAPVFSGSIEETEIGVDSITVSLPTATDDSKVAVTYELFLNGEKVDAYAGEASYTFTGLTAATTYTIKLVATDIVGRTAEVVLETATVGLGKIEVSVDLSDLGVSAETMHMNVFVGDKSVPVDKDGKAVIENLSAGTYTVTFKAAGFFTVAKAEIMVSNGQGSAVTFTKKEIVAGDTTDDGVIDIYDLNAVASAFAESYDGETGLIYDFNRDGKVNAEDIEILVANYNKAMAE